MNKTFLLVAAIFAFIMVPILLLYGFAMFGVREIIEADPELAAQIPVEFYGFFNFLGVLMISFGVIDLIAGIRLVAARNGKASSREAMGWSIYLIFGAGIIAGVFGILGAKTDETQNYSTTSSPLENQLKELDDLFSKGLINKEEYQNRRAKLIDKV